MRWAGSLSVWLGEWRGVLLGAVACGVGACAGAGGTSSRLAADDFVALSEWASASLRDSEVMRERTAASEAWRVALTDPVNLSSDLITPAERWMVMRRVVDGAGMRALARERSLVFVVAREVADRVEGVEVGAWGGIEAMGERAPTHTLEGVFRSVTRRAGEDRADLYAFQLSIRDVGAGEVVWSESFLLKRAAIGRAWD